jgi:DNA-binding CsgD family transcriptional regulator
VAPVGGVIGREDELVALEAFLEGGAGRALLLGGAAGIGKTTLWRAGVAAAERRGFRVLAAGPAAAEADFSYGALGDLLRPLLADVREELPEPQARALGVALLVEDATGLSPDRRAVAVATRSALRALAAEAPVLVAVDDVQWLDAPSAFALAFAARRLGEESVSFLLSRRETADGGRSSLEDALGERVGRVEVGPLGLDDLHRLLQARLGTPLPRPALRRVHELSGGNPFYALELARAREEHAGGLAPAEALPMTLDALVRDRIASLPAETRTALTAAAALSQPSLRTLASVLERPAEEALAPALAAGVVELRAERLEFAHPLLASAAYLAPDPVARRALHRRLAAVADDVEERARHLGLSADGPDSEVAATLAAGAERARSRGAPETAAFLAERAAELTPPDRGTERRERRAAAAVHHFESGDAPRARAILEELAAGLEPGPERAAVLVRLARVRSYGDDLRAAADLYADALGEAGADGHLAAVAHEGLSACLFRLRERLPEAREHAHTAAELGRASGDLALAAEALGTQLAVEAVAGRPEARATAAAALAARGAGSFPRVLADPELIAAFAAMWWDELERAREPAERLLVRAHEAGDESSLPYVLFLLAQLECREGAFAAARAHADQARELSVQAGQVWLEAYALALVALAEAWSGRAGGCREAAGRALELAARTSAVPAEYFAATAVGHLDLSLGEPGAALRSLEPLVERAEREGIHEPGATPFLPDALEALVAAGRLEDADRLLRVYGERARALERSSALAAAARAAGLLLAARGDGEAALAHLEGALELHERVALPAERARTLLALGAARRRAKHKRAAREALEESLAVFASLGATVWAEAARAELGRIGGRAAGRGDLTPSERRVAALVAEGRTNREAAAELFLSERTVEGHLSRVYAKLGVRSRAELARRFRDSPPGA